MLFEGVDHHGGTKLLDVSNKYELCIVRQNGIKIYIRVTGCYERNELLEIIGKLFGGKKEGKERNST